MKQTLIQPIIPNKQQEKMKVKSTVFIFFVIFIFCSSCMSFKITSNNTTNSNQNKLTGYVINAEEYKTEFKILKHSKKYNLIKDSTQADVFIALKDLTYLPIGCITPQVTLSFFTLGFYPVKYQERYIFEYEKISGSKKETLTKNIEIEKIVSWFHLFSFKKNRKKVIGKSV